MQDSILYPPVITKSNARYDKATRLHSHCTSFSVIAKSAARPSIPVIVRKDKVLPPPRHCEECRRHDEAISLRGFSMLGCPPCSSLRGRTEVLTKQSLFFRTSGRPIRLHPNYRRLLRTLTRPRNDRKRGGLAMTNDRVLFPTEIATDATHPRNDKKRGTPRNDRWDTIVTGLARPSQGQIGRDSKVTPREVV